MHGEEGDAHPRDVLDPARDRVTDIVQFHVEEDPLAGVGQRGRQWQAALEGELIADLVEADRIAERLDDGLGVTHRGKIEGDDQPIARLQWHGPAHANSRAISTSRLTAAARSRALRSSLRLSASSNAWPASRTATCSGITSAPQPSSSI